MIIHLENTEKIVHVNGVPARVWEGHTDGTDIPVIAFITRIAVERESDCSQFELELEECVAPSAEAQSFPARMTL